MVAGTGTDLGGRRGEAPRLTSINRDGGGRGSLFPAMTRVRFAVVLAAALLFAAAPAVRAYCIAAMPGTVAAASQAEVAASVATGDDGAGHHERCCCESPPVAAVDERASTKDGAPSGGKLPLPLFTLPSVAFVGGGAPAPHLAGHRAPPPEPALRRSPRRLL
jgi:hypothetical protein